MNHVTINGYVKGEVKANDNGTIIRFSVSSYKGKVDGKNQYQYITIKCINPKFKLNDGDYVLVSGELDSYKYNDKYYTDVKCFGDGLAKVQNMESTNHSAPSSDAIPF